MQKRCESALHELESNRQTAPVPPIQPKLIPFCIRKLIDQHLFSVPKTVATTVNLFRWYALYAKLVSSIQDVLVRTR